MLSRRGDGAVGEAVPAAPEAEAEAVRAQAASVVADGDEALDRGGAPGARTAASQVPRGGRARSSRLSPFACLDRTLLSWGLWRTSFQEHHDLPSDGRTFVGTAVVFRGMDGRIRSLRYSREGAARGWVADRRS